MAREKKINFFWRGVSNGEEFRKLINERYVGVKLTEKIISAFSTRAS